MALNDNRVKLTVTLSYSPKHGQVQQSGGEKKYKTKQNNKSLYYGYGTYKRELKAPQYDIKTTI